MDFIFDVSGGDLANEVLDLLDEIRGKLPLEMKKAQELEKRIEGMKDQLSKEQLETFVKLKEKFAKALTQK